MPIVDAESRIERYAEILVRVGINLQAGQIVVIRGAKPEVAPLVRAVTARAYAHGAAFVHVLWSDLATARLGMLHASEEQLGVYPTWEGPWMVELAEQGAAFIILDAPDYEAAQGLDPRRLTLRAHASSRALRPFQAQIMGATVSWLVAALPTASWAARVFPDLPSDQALERLWDLIGRATRLDSPDPAAAWAAHLDQLRARVDGLTRAGLRSLTYRAPGTELTVELLPDCRWVAAGTTSSARGVSFVPNMPTDEVFTTPRRDGAHGTVRCTFPLYYNGVLIEDISLRFERGRIVEATASSGIEVLTGVLDTDEGARQLGEVALVPVDSAVAGLRTVFYNTLYDENASCHLAFGSGLAIAVQGGEGQTAEALLARGVNQSAVHVDVMIGSEQLDIDGTTAQGAVVPILRRGKWVLAG